MCVYIYIYIYIKNIKGKSRPYARHINIKRSRGTAPLIPHLGTISRWQVNITTRPLYPRERTTEQEPRWTPQQVWTFRKRITLSSTGIQTPTRPDRSLVCVPTTPSRFPHKTYNMIHYIIYISYIWNIFFFNFASPSVPPPDQRPWCPSLVTPQGLYVNLLAPELFF